MALCHDERDFAMGWSRRDPHAGKGLDREQREAAEKREKYLISLTPHQKRAYERVKLCLIAVGEYHEGIGALIPIVLGELHKHFPTFAKELGFKGPLYQKKGDGCPAVSISFPEDKDSAWFITPSFNYRYASEDDKQKVQTKAVRQAALNFCKAWLPGWKWEQAKLR